MRRSNAPTLQDVAREAGVTAMTVSVVLNGARSSTRVSEATRARVLEAAGRLRYRRNAVAHGLSRNRMDTIGVVTVIDGGELNLYFLEVLNGILEAAGAYGQNTTIFSIADWQKEESKILPFCDGRVDGMILIAPLFTPAFVGSFSCHIPFVTLHSNDPLPGSDNLDVDNEGGAYAIVRHLIEQGHRRILHLGASLELGGAQRRLTGYRRALEAAGIPYDTSLVIPGGFSFWSGRTRMLELLERRPHEPLPSAIFCASDAIAYGCMEALALHGIRVPEDISVTGFDDTLTARMTTPALTTVSQPFCQMGRRAVELLLFQMGHDSVSGPEGFSRPATSAPAPDARIEMFPVELVVRASVGAPPEQPIIPARLPRPK